MNAGKPSDSSSLGASAPAGYPHRQPASAAAAQSHEQEPATGYPLRDGGGSAWSAPGAHGFLHPPSSVVVTTTTTTTTTTTYSARPVGQDSGQEPSINTGTRFQPWRCLVLGERAATITSNIVWLVFGGGLVIGMLWAVFSVLACFTIVCIPAGLKFLQFSKFAFLPFNKYLYRSRPICAWPESCLNIVWLPFGIMLWAIQAGLGLAYCLTLIGIPIGLVHLQMCHLFLWPFGSEVPGSDGSIPLTATTNETTTVRREVMQPVQEFLSPPLPHQEMTQVSVTQS